LPGEEKKATDLWKKFCENGKEGGKEGNIFIHCKHPLRPETRYISTTLTGGTADLEQREQYIFVQPPPLHFNHNLKVTSKGSLEPKTIVYVKPARTTHTYDTQIDKGTTEHKKPELVFLSADTGSGPVIEDSDEPVPVARQVRQALDIDNVGSGNTDNKVMYSKSYTVVSVQSDSDAQKPVKR